MNQIIREINNIAATNKVGMNIVCRNDGIHLGLADAGWGDTRQKTKQPKKGDH